MTHERCSELLGPYVRGELPADAAGEVRAHLEECDECRMEERALGVLLGDAPGLDDVERARLHRWLAQELGPGAANADVVATAPAARAWARWVGPAAGAAAVVAAIAFVGLAGGLTGGGDDSEGGVTAELGAPAREGDAFDRGGGGGGRRHGRSSAQAGTAADAVEAEEAGGRAHNGDDAQRGSLYASGPQPGFDLEAGSLDAARLSETGRSGGVFTSFASTYSVDQAPGIQEEFLARLVDEAGPAAPDVRECARTMPEDPTVVAVYGATGEYEGRDALVLGFVTSESGERFDRYLMWVWERGRCEQPIDTLIGDIDS